MGRVKRKLEKALDQMESKQITGLWVVLSPMDEELAESSRKNRRVSQERAC
jgi:hypothetical protein